MISGRGLDASGVNLRQRSHSSCSITCLTLDLLRQNVCAAHILAPLLKTKLVKRIGTRKTGRDVLA
jgi:hypothetical protein